MSLTELRAIRMSNLGITTRTGKLWGVSPNLALTLEEIVASLGAVQGQDYPGTIWALGLRLPGSREQDIATALESGSVVRTWPMRGTLHFVAAADLRWMVKLLTPRVIARTLSRHQQLELNGAQFLRSQETMRKVLADGAILSRETLLAALEADGISVAGGRGYHLLFRAAMDQVICGGPTRNKQQTFALLDAWVPVSRDRGLEGEAAIAELTWRYFSSHGPATTKDFAGWSGLTMGEVKAGIAANQGRLEKLKVEDKEYWWAGRAGASRANSMGDPKPDGPNEPDVHILPGFDEFVLGYKDRSAILDPDYADRICPGSNGVFQPTLVINGQVRGTWKKTLRKGKVIVEAQPFTKISRSERDGLATAVKRLGAFYGVSGELA